MKFLSAAGSRLLVFQKMSSLLVAEACAWMHVHRKKMEKNGLALIGFLFLLLQQSFAAGPITGKVTDEQGQGLSGVSVTVQGKTEGVTTGAQGRYSINLPEGSNVLV